MWSAFRQHIADVVLGHMVKALKLDDISPLLQKFNEIRKKLYQLQLVNERVAYETTSWRITCLLKKERSDCIVGKSNIIRTKQ